MTEFLLLATISLFGILGIAGGQFDYAEIALGLLGVLIYHRINGIDENGIQHFRITITGEEEDDDVSG